MNSRKLTKSIWQISKEMGIHAMTVKMHLKVLFPNLESKSLTIKQENKLHQYLYDIGVLKELILESKINYE